MVHTVLLKKYITLNANNKLQESSLHYSNTRSKSSIRIPVHYPTCSSTLQIVGVHMRLITSAEELWTQSHVESKNKTIERNNNAGEHRDNAVKMSSKPKFEYFSNNSSSNNKNSFDRGNAVNQIQEVNTEGVHRTNHGIHINQSSNIQKELNNNNELLQISEKTQLRKREGQEVDIFTTVRVTANVHGESDLESKQFVVGIVQLCSENCETATERGKKIESTTAYNKNTTNIVKRVKHDFATNATSCDVLHVTPSSSLQQMSAFLKLDLRLQVEQLEFDIDVLNVQHVLHSVNQANSTNNASEKGKNEKAKESGKKANAMVEVAIIGAITTLVERKQQ